MEKYRNATVRGEGLSKGVTVLRSPEGLARPVSSPGSLFSSRGTVRLKARKHIYTSTTKIRAAEDIVTPAADVVEAEDYLALQWFGGRCAGASATESEDPGSSSTGVWHGWSRRGGNICTCKCKRPEHGWERGEAEKE